jgi:pimeloyl-ACP methyl ester carboxylesterase
LRQIRTRTLEFGIFEQGTGPLALCLHGFPDSAYTWRHLLPELARAGFHAVAPFMRGYAPTSLAADGRYSVGSLVADCVALHDALGGDDQAVVIGHDWGAEAAYGAAVFAPERFRKLVTLAIPPPRLHARLFTDYGQLRRFWYQFFFQTRFAPAVVGAGEMAFLDRLWRDWSPGYDATDDLIEVKQSMRDPHHLAAAIQYYRAAAETSPPSPDDPYAAEQAAASSTPPQPTLYLHGSDDGCIGVEMVRDSEPHLAGGSRFVELDGLGHFLHLEDPKRVNELILDWVTG